jgi:hypothetical protein
MTKMCKAESSYNSVNFIVAHCGGIEPVMMLRLRSLIVQDNMVYDVSVQW